MNISPDNACLLVPPFEVTDNHVMVAFITEFGFQNLGLASSPLMMASIRNTLVEAAEVTRKRALGNVLYKGASQCAYIGRYRWVDTESCIIDNDL